MRFEEKLGYTNRNPERIYLYIMDLIRSDWKHTFKNEISLNTFCYNNQGTRQIKDFQKHSNKKIYFILLSNNTKYIKVFKFILWKDTIISILIFGATSVLIGLQSVQITKWFPFGTSLFIFSFF